MSSEIVVRRAIPDDIDTLHRLIERAYRGETARAGWSHEANLLDGQRTDVEALTAIMADPREIMLVATDAGDLIGCVRLADEGEGQAYLGMLTVEPTLQAGGLGRRLLAEAEATAREVWATRVMRMTVIRQRDELIAWYQRRDYRLTGAEEPFPGDDPRFGLPKRQDLVFVVLEKPLA